jgi:5-methylcytosine-specific restriction protein A
MSLRPACATPRCPHRAAPGSSRCNDCKPLAGPSYRKDPKLKAIYNSARWQKVRKRKLGRDPICEFGFEGCLKEAEDVHHKVPLSEGGKPFSMENLMSGCKPCHTRHELEERRRKKMAVVLR